MDLPALAGHFRIPEATYAINPVGSGHINRTFLVTATGTSGEKFILQQVNRQVFPNVPALMENIDRVSRHILGRLVTQTEDRRRFTTLRIIPSRLGELCITDESGEYWRLYEFIAGRSFDHVPGPAFAREAGRAFGRFHALASGLDAATLHEVLPGFHDVSLRLNRFRAAVETDPVGRKRDAGAEIGFAQDRAGEMSVFNSAFKTGTLPVRITHNDTKFNNVLFDADGQAMAVVDLDTVMPGTVLYDFGDAIRTGTATAEEDDPEGISFDPSLFAAYTQGYLSEALSFLTREETERLAFSARYMTYIIGLRFLTDYLEGDRYFRIHRQDHNLRRARAQFRLLGAMEDQFSLMESMVRDSC